MSFDNAICLNESMPAKMLLQLEAIPENSKVMYLLDTVIFG